MEEVWTMNKAVYLKSGMYVGRDWISSSTNIGIPVHSISRYI